jgi:hypothetical protein
MILRCKSLVAEYKQGGGDLIAGVPQGRMKIARRFNAG